MAQLALAPSRRTLGTLTQSRMAKNLIHIGSKTKPSRVLVVGASGELGGALASHYAATGAALWLWGRDQTRLERIAAVCRKAGAASLATRSLDLRDVDSAITAMACDDEAAHFDLVIIASGSGDIRAEGALIEGADLVSRLGFVNFVAPAAIAAEVGSRMARRRHGAIVLIGSAAAFHALPFAAAYAGSKAGLARFADALRISLRPHGVCVTLVSPGFIDTAAARLVPGPKPLIMSADKATRLIAKAAARGKPHVIMPWPFALLKLIDRILPRPLRDRVLRALTPPGR